MKKLIYALVLTLVVTSCKKNDFVTFSGKIENKTSDSIVIANPQKGYTKTIKINTDGTFKDTLNVDNGFFALANGKQYATVYFSNGDEIKMNADASKFDETISFNGKGADENNFLAKTKLTQKDFTQSIRTIIELPKEDFDTKVNAFVSDFNTRLNKKPLDTAFVSIQKRNIEYLNKQLNAMHEESMYKKTVLAKGKPSPKFVNYEKPNRETVSLDDLKGKYVYMDIWATWCKPCTDQIPFLQKIEEQYHGKNIEFVSISIDSRDDYFTWNDMVEEKKLGGIQLYSNEDKAFTGAYKINEIPRFILVDPEGNIVSADAPRPSDPKLVELFDSLGI